MTTADHENSRGLLKKAYTKLANALLIFALLVGMLVTGVMLLTKMKPWAGFLVGILAGGTMGWFCSSAVHPALKEVLQLRRHPFKKVA